MAEFILHTQTIALENAKELLNGVQKNFNFLPLIFRHMAEAPVALESLLALMNLVSKTSLTPAQQQIASLAASVENDCVNCIVGHRVLGKMAKTNEQTLEAVYTRHDIGDPKDRASRIYPVDSKKSRTASTSGRRRIYHGGVYQATGI